MREALGKVAEQAILQQLDLFDLLLSMASLDKPEFPPLLSVGFHPMSIQDVRTLCVDSFPLSKRRSDVMKGLEQILSLLVDARVIADIWLDGSFLTHKVDPDDVDFIVYIQENDFINFTESQNKMLDWIAGEDLKEQFHCDCYVLFEYPKDHPLYWEGQWMKAYWMKQFGFSRKEHMKGMPVLKVGDYQ